MSGAAPTANRVHLPNRRWAISAEIAGPAGNHDGARWTVTIGGDDNFNVLEIFASPRRHPDSSLAMLVDDAMISQSLLLQAGFSLDDLVARHGTRSFIGRCLALAVKLGQDARARGVPAS